MKKRYNKKNSELTTKGTYIAVRSLTSYRAQPAKLSLRLRRRKDMKRQAEFGFYKA